MNRFFRNAHPGLRDYVLLGLFAAIYLCALVLVIAPATLLGG